MGEIVFTKARAFLCLWCRRNWPPYEEFAVCPCCREETTASNTGPPMNDEEARSLAVHMEFGWYLWETEQL